MSIEWRVEDNRIECRWAIDLTPTYEAAWSKIEDSTIAPAIDFERVSPFGSGDWYSVDRSR